MKRKRVEAEEIIRAFHKALVDFGYKSLTYQYVLEATKKALAGIGYDPSRGGTVISEFIKGWLEGEYKALRPILEEYFKEMEERR